MTTLQYIRFLSLVLALMSGLAHAQGSAVFDARQNAWKLYYQEPETDQWVHKTYVQQNAINPRIKSTVQSDRTQYVYRYLVSNRRGAKQAIDAIRVWGYRWFTRCRICRLLLPTRKSIPKRKTSNSGRN